ncbi:MAG: signal peptidase I [Pseudomonadota bacterium]
MFKNKRLKQFLFPKITLFFLLRVFALVLFTYLFFGYVFTPIYIDGFSMEPTYENGEWNFCNKVKYIYSKPKRYDVVLIKYAGKKVMLMKRIVAFSGETVEFKNGNLLINGKRLKEPYLFYNLNWNLEARKVEEGNIYVIGDNRSTPIEQHVFGQTPLTRIVGSVSW